MMWKPSPDIDQESAAVDEGEGLGGFPHKNYDFESGGFSTLAPPGQSPGGA
jgi:hypothetical protein